MAEQVTIKKLIENKDKIEEGKKDTKDLYIKNLDGYVTIEKPDKALIMDVMDMATDDTNESNGDDYLVYNIMKNPDLKSSDLQKAYNCTEPTDIVSEIFEPGTIQSIAQYGMEMAGYDEKGVQPVDELKNS